MSERIRPASGARVRFAEPLSAQAHAPSRPSGADKKEIENKGHRRQSWRSRPDRADIAANRHVHPLHRRHRVTQNCKRTVAPRRLDGRVLSEIGVAAQGLGLDEYVRNDDLLPSRNVPTRLGIETARASE